MTDRSRRYASLLIVCLSIVATVHAGQKSDSSNIETGYITSDDGARLFYRKIGSGPQTVIVPLGFMLFQDFQVLAKGRTMIFYDMRDRGKSDELTDPAKITIQKDVDDLEAVRRHFHAHKVSLIGESYLGMMVILYTTQHPEHVERVVQIGPVSRRFGTKYPPEFTASDSGQVPDPAELKKLDALEKSGYAAAHPKQFCEQDWKVERTGLAGNPANAVRAGDGYCEFPNEWPAHLNRHFDASISSIQKLDIRDSDLAKVTMPVLTIHGTKDRNAPYGGGREWAATLPDARLVTIVGAAHFPWLDNPDLVFSSIDTFLRGDWPHSAEKITSTTSVK
ncbi:MAG TPA: alpha/beta hydrolase [Candidatus Limnocylindrales bacterium]|nr:alpha/beta hydrolase [Candidatus Limnocylindrales bacterium]